MNRQSFTLLELIVVIAIIAILAAIIAPNAFRAIEKAKVSRAVRDFKTIKNAAAALYANTGRWPINYNPSAPCSGAKLGSTPLLVDPGWPAWDGPYLEKDFPHPWGGIYSFIWPDYGGDPNVYDLVLSIEDNCYPHPAAGLGCGVPTESERKIDRMVDDGNLTTGAVRKYGGGSRNLLNWALFFDCFTCN